MANRYVDCDGNVTERLDEIGEYLGEPFRTSGHINPRRSLPSLDRFHAPRLEERKPGTFDPTVGLEEIDEIVERKNLKEEHKAAILQDLVDGEILPILSALR